MSILDNLLEGIPIPRMVRAHQKFDGTAVEDLGNELAQKIRQNEGYQGITPGMKIAVGVGSRGVANLPLIIRTIVDQLKAAGAEPFLIPAMGSHGGATAEGQKSMLAGMGITEESMGVPVRATMETVQLGVSAEGVPVYLDRYANEADGMVVVNRIKPHVAFRGPYESGLMKMITIGFGKQKGAETCHMLGFGHMAVNIPSIARVTIEKKNILFAVGLLENAYHETCRVEVLDKCEIEGREPALQEQAKALAPRIQFDQADVLVIDEIGKDISGTGFDTNVVGRYHTPFASGGPSITKIAVLDLTERSHGNANGVGILDFTTRRLADKFSPEDTYPNALTSTVVTSVKLPMVLPNDRMAIQAAIKTCNIIDKTQVRMVRIKNTLELDEISFSETMLEEARQNPNLELLSDPFELPFNAEGNLF